MKWITESDRRRRLAKGTIRTMKRWLKVFWPIGMASGALLLVAAGAWSVGGTAQADTAVMKVVPASQTVDIGDGTFTVDIVIENVSDLAAFEFVLNYDPSILGLVGVEKGPFLDESGGEVSCQVPQRISPADNVPSEESLRFGCASINTAGGGENISGASGTGVAATVTFAPQKTGTSELRLLPEPERYHSSLGDPYGAGIPLSLQDGSVKVTGSGPAATPKPDEPTTIPAQTPGPRITPVATPPDLSYLTPEPGEPVLVRPIVSADTTAANSNGGADGESAANGSPRAGTGPPEKGTPWWPILASGLLAVGGVALLSLAAYARWAVERRHISE
jgi:hypothetical protein